MTFHWSTAGARGPPGSSTRVFQLLELYRAANPSLIKIENLNPYTELSAGRGPGQARPRPGGAQGGGVLIEYGEGTDAEFMVVPAQEMFAPLSPDAARQGSDRFESVFKGEDAITSALIRTARGEEAEGRLHHRPRRAVDLRRQPPEPGARHLARHGWPPSATRCSSST